MKVKEILETKRNHGEILKVAASDAIALAVDIMSKNDTGSVAVYNTEGIFVGMLTFREIIKAVNDNAGNIDGVQVDSVLDTEVPCVTQDDSVDQIRNVMINGHHRYLPVVEDGEVIDIISFYDVARAVAKSVDFENRMLKEYIRNWPTDDE